MPETQLQQPQRQRKIFVFIIVIVMITAVFYGVYLWKSARDSASMGHGHEAPPTPVNASIVHPESLPQALQAIGSLKAKQEVDIASEVAGTISALHFVSGQKVKVGDPLVQLNDSVERAQLAGAMAQVKYAELQLRRAKELSSTGAESTQTLQLRVSELEQAHAAVNQLNALIGQKMLIRAPFSGQIGIRNADLGQYVDPGVSFTHLTALDELYVNFTVPQQELSKLAVDGKVIVETDAYPGQQFEAYINAINPVINADTRNIAVQATLSNDRDLLRPGLFVTVHVELPSRDNVIILPLTAVQTSAYGDMVYKVKDGTVTIVPVITGQHVGDRVVIEKGVMAGEVVILDGQVRVYPGSSVTVVQGDDHAGAVGQ
ncbi:efflux RND transporter periplasmic adaptor subunit [Kordiimonas pumila]|uniref:Efflux RND transporter periplasmic adaptor subunit n=1 Tax=Kordiimonas pumila TaxID=2161677 RepID=A0ABV7D7N1_9PROT|nr:efflux RND transporter periplasmic adaptor subunit [Kordiimonas pumila]